NMTRRVQFSLLVVLLASLAVSARQSVQLPAPGNTEDVIRPGTFSILGYDPVTEEVGAAVQSRVFAVGNGVIWAEAGVGAVATQAVVDVGYGPKGMQLLKDGMAPKDIVKKLYDDDK